MSYEVQCKNIKWYQSSCKSNFHLYHKNTKNKYQYSNLWNILYDTNFTTYNQSKSTQSLKPVHKCKKISAFVAETCNRLGNKTQIWNRYKTHISKSYRLHSNWNNSSLKTVLTRTKHYQFINESNYKYFVQQNCYDMGAHESSPTSYLWEFHESNVPSSDT